MSAVKAVSRLDHSRFSNEGAELLVGGICFVTSPMRLD